MNKSKSAFISSVRGSGRKCFSLGILILLILNSALAGVAQWIECGPANQRLLVQFPVRAHAWIAGLVPVGALEKQPYIDPSFSFPSPLSKNK